MSAGQASPILLVTSPACVVASLFTGRVFSVSRYRNSNTPPEGGRTSTAAPGRPPYCSATETGGALSLRERPSCPKGGVARVPPHPPFSPLLKALAAAVLG